MAQAQARMIKRTFKTPEGRFSLCTDRPLSCHFNPARPPKLTLATLTMGLDAGMYMIFNVMDSLHICTLAETNKQALRAIAFGMTPGGNMIYPTCHAFTQVNPRDGYDLVIGLSTGDVVVASVHQQLMASASNTKVVGMLRFNIDSEVDSTRVVGAEWVPQRNGQFFIVGHLSGKVYLYNKASAMADDDSQGESGGSAQNRMPAAAYEVSRKGLNAFAVSPDGSRLATAARDGTVRIHELTSGAMLAGFRVYYGNPTCIAWSADGACVSAGGEDDLVTVFSVAEQRVVAWCEGHTSWVTAIRFDAWATRQTGEPQSESATGSTSMEVDSSAAPSSPAEEEAAPPGTTYRLVSLGQDCHICMWDVTIPDTPALQATAREPEPAAAAQARQAAPEVRPWWDSAPGMMNGALKPHRRLGAGTGSSPMGQGSPTSHNLHSSSSASSLSLGPEIIPVTPRKDMAFVPCVASSRIHVEPGSDLLFLQNLMFTACFGGQVKAWERLRPQPVPPEPPAPAQAPPLPAPPAQPAHASTQPSTQAPAGKASAHAACSGQGCGAHAEPGPSRIGTLACSGCSSNAAADPNGSSSRCCTSATAGPHASSMAGV